MSAPQAQKQVCNNKTIQDTKLQELQGRLLIRLNAYEKMIAELNQKQIETKKENSELKNYIHNLQKQLKQTKCRVKKIELNSLKCNRDIKEIQTQIIHNRKFSDNLQSIPLNRQISQNSIKSDHNSQENIKKDEEETVDIEQVLNEVVLASKKSGQGVKTILNLSDNKLTIEQIKFLENNNWSNLIELNLSSTYINDKCLEILVNLEWDNLQRLHLALNNITDDGVEHILKMKLPKLKILNLYGNQISEEGLKKIVDHSWNSMQKIFIDNNNISQIDCVCLRENDRLNCKQKKICVCL